MAAIRVGISAALGVLVTFALLIVMYKLIDSGNKDLDEKEAIKIADFLHVDREVSENVKKTEVEKPEDPETPPPEIPEENIEFDVPDDAVSMAAPAANANLKIGGAGCISATTNITGNCQTDATFNAS